MIYLGQLQKAAACRYGFLGKFQKAAASRCGGCSPSGLVCSLI
jgi:hypothetical protein